jgi:hypothetical protein
VADEDQGLVHRANPLARADRVHALGRRCNTREDPRSGPGVNSVGPPQSD